MICVAGGIPGYASAMHVFVIASKIGDVGNMMVRMVGTQEGTGDASECEVVR